MRLHVQCSLVLAAAAFFAAAPARALPQSGTLDADFGTNGVAVTDLLGTGNPAYSGFAAARHPVTGALVVAAAVTGSEGHEQWTVMGFNADGTRNAAFGKNGIVRTDFQPFDADPDHPIAIAFDTSGPPSGQRTLVAGYATVPNLSNFGIPGQHLAVAAYLSDGTLDASFAGSGVFLFAGSYAAQAMTVEAMPDGKTLVAGMRDYDCVVLRLMHDGTLDSSYGSGGIATVATNGGFAVAAAIQPDGGAVIGLQNYSYFPVFTPEVQLVRLSPGGSPDLGFGSGGTLALANEQLSGLVARSDGTLVGLHAGVNYFDPYRLRVYAADGSTVGSDVMLPSGFGPGPMDVASDGSVVLGGTSSINYSVFSLVKTTPSLSLDPSFDTDGLAALDLGGYQSSAHALALPGGELAVVGLRNDPLDFQTSFVVSKVLSDGSHDVSFAAGVGFGSFEILASSQDTGQDIAVHQADGKLVTLARTIGGNASSAVVRYLDDGTLDASFGEGGIRRFEEAPLVGMTGTGIGLQASGRIVVTGMRYDFLPTAPFVEYYLLAVGLDTDGNLDPSFGGGDGIGKLTIPGALYAFGGGIAVQPDDKILACTTAYVTFPSSEMCVARFLADGSVDTGFGTGGVAWVANAGSSVTATSLAVAADGRIAVAGNVDVPWPVSTSEVALAWLGSSGSVLSGPVTSVPGFGVDVAVDSTGRAVVAAQRYWGNPVYDEFFNLIDIVGESPWSPTEFAALRVLPGGSLDASFGAAGIATMGVPTADNAYATTLAIQPDGSIVLAGSATIQPTPSTYANDFIVLRLLSGGAPDASFSGDGAANADVGPLDAPQSCLLQSDGKIVLVGVAVAYGSGFSQKSDLAVIRIHGLNNPYGMVEALIDDVQALVENQQLKHGHGKSLSMKLHAALSQIEKQQYATAENQLTAFKNHVLALQSTNILSSSDAASLIASADAILALL